MRKIPTLFVRQENGKLVTPVVNEGCEWVVSGEGTPTVKLDGSCCMVKDGVFYRRYIAKVAPSPEEAAIIGFVPVNDDGKDGHRHGWIPVGNTPNDQYHREAWQYTTYSPMVRMPYPMDWTYELVGPKVQGNPYNLNCHQLWRHAEVKLFGVPRTFDGLSDFLVFMTIEGIVWWRDINDPDCDKCKVKRKDFNLPWPVKA